ncbi:MAG: ribosome silencing factor [Clostridiales bacterium]|nr:ribosome silencing factor [Clostridiales bacterium]MBQ2818425.1 ribosome silencing factor [Clostridia bacterium]MBQ4637617.1 ribosome silencing factor [Clostridia bacterium]
MEGKELATKIAAILDAKRGRDIDIISLRDLTIVADYFVVCTAMSSLQARALADEVEEQLEAEGIDLIRHDGRREATWIVMDYGHVIVHIFDPDQRQFYNIERLWADTDNMIRYSTPD